MRLEKAVELVDDAIHQLDKLNEKWQDRLSLDNLRISERYVKGTIDLLVHIYVREPDDLGYFCAILRYHEPTARRIANQSLSVGHELSHGRNVGEQVSELRVIVAKAESREAIAHDQQQAVFIDNVKLVELPEAIVPSSIRLEGIKDANRGRANSLYHSLKLGFVYGSSLADGKISPFGRDFAVGLDQLPSQVVEAAPKLMDSFASDQRNVCGELRANVDAKDAVSALRVRLASDSIWVGFAKGFNSAFEIVDVVFGPFDLCLDTKQSG
jgi:hypothetical protein